jgi:predicted Zn-dependent protease
LQPANATISNTYGWLLFQTSVNHADGIALLEKAVALAPSNPALRLQLGQAYIALGRKGAARFALTPIAANPNFAEQAEAARLLSHL